MRCCVHCDDRSPHSLCVANSHLNLCTRARVQRCEALQRVKWGGSSRASRHSTKSIDNIMFRLCGQLERKLANGE